MRREGPPHRAIERSTGRNSEGQRADPLWASRLSIGRSIEQLARNSSGLPALEQERRARILDDIRQRIALDGPRVAVPSPDRGRLFMPFAALKGYERLVEEAARDDDA